MDGDLGSMLQSVLSDPEQMARIAQAAQGLMQTGPDAASGASGSAGTTAASGTSAAAGTVAASPPPEPVRDDARDARLLATLGRAFGAETGKSKSTALLVAMRPYMKPEKQKKLDSAMRIARMVRVAGEVMRQIGGGHGI